MFSLRVIFDPKENIMFNQDLRSKIDLSCFISLSFNVESCMETNQMNHHQWLDLLFNILFFSFVYLSLHLAHRVSTWVFFKSDLPISSNIVSGISMIYYRFD